MTTTITRTNGLIDGFQQEQKFFKPIKGSNYKIMMTYDREEIVEYAQFLKIAHTLLENDKNFLSVNDRIVAKNSIIDISPTKTLTNNQIKEKEERLLDTKKLEGDKAKLEEFKTLFNTSFFNLRHGEGKWAWVVFSYQKRNGVVQISDIDIKDAQVAFVKAYPHEAKEIAELNKKP